MKNMNLLKTLPALLTSIALATAVSCTPYQQQGAAVGALGGAGLGAIAGNDGSDVVTGAALGAAAGAGVAAYREDQSRRSNSQPYAPPRSQRYTPPAQRPTYQPPPRTTTPSTSPAQPSRTSSGKYPMATPSIKPNTVISPYPPYNVLDTTGASSGDKLCDPSTIPIDPATGKQYVNPATGLPDVKRGKYFIVP